MRSILRASLNPTTPTTRQRRSPGHVRGVSKTVVLVVLAVLGGGLVAAVVGFSGGDGADSSDSGTAVVKRGSLVISVTEEGTLRAKESVNITNEVEGSSTVAELVDEGTYVEKGQVILKMDAKELIDRKTQQEAKLQTIEAEYKASVLNLAIKKNEALSKLSKAQQKVRFAKMDLDKYLQGDYPQKKRKTESDIVIAKAEMTQAEDELYWTEKLLAKGVVTRQKLDGDKLTVEKAKIKVTQAEEALRLLEKFELVKEKARLESEHVESERELERVKQQNESNIALMEAQAASSKVRRDIRKAEFKKLLEQIDKATIRAPQSGMLVYEAPGRWSNNQPLAVGVMTRYGQKLFKLPDLSKMEVDVKIHESQIERIEAGQQAEIRINAFAGQVFQGKVQRIGVMASRQRWFNPDVKVYETVVSLDGEAVRMKPGMSAEVCITCKTIKDVLLVPVTGVHILNGRDAAIVTGGSDLKIREVAIGETDDEFVIVTSGLEEGDKVLLYEPEVMPTIPWPPPHKEKEKVAPDDIGGEPPAPPRESRPEQRNGRSSQPRRGDRQKSTPAAKTPSAPGGR